jgi:hypothetical protein
MNFETDITNAWENIGKHIKIAVRECLGHYELKKQKPLLDSVQNF